MSTANDARPFLLLVRGILSDGAWCEQICHDDAVVAKYRVCVYPHWYGGIQFAARLGRSFANKRFQEWVAGTLNGAPEQSAALIAHSFGTMLAWRLIEDALRLEGRLVGRFHTIHFINSPLDHELAIHPALQSFHVKQFVQDYSLYDWTMVLSRMVACGDAGLFEFAMPERGIQSWHRRFRLGHCPTKKHLEDYVIPMYREFPPRPADASRTSASIDLPSRLRRAFSSSVAFLLRLVARSFPRVWIPIGAVLVYWLIQTLSMAAVAEAEKEAAKETAERERLAKVAAETEKAVLTREVEIQRQLAGFLQRQLEGQFRLSNAVLPGLPLSRIYEKADDLQLDARETFRSDPRSQIRVLSAAAYAFTTCLELDKAEICLRDAEGLLSDKNRWLDERVSIESVRALVLAIECRCQRALNLTKKIETDISASLGSDVRKLVLYRLNLARSIALALAPGDARELTKAITELSRMNAKLPGASDDRWLFHAVSEIHANSIWRGATTFGELFIKAESDRRYKALLDTIINWRTASEARVHCTFEETSSSDVTKKYQTLLNGFGNPPDPATLYPFAAIDYGGFLVDSRVAKHKEAIALGENLFKFISSRSSNHPLLVTVKAHMAASAYMLSKASKDNQFGRRAVEYAEWATEPNRAAVAAEMPTSFRYNGSTRLENILSESKKQ